MMIVLSCVAYFLSASRRCQPCCYVIVNVNWILCGVSFVLILKAYRRHLVTQIFDIDTLIETTDSRLFRSITYPDHCLNYLLPSKRNYTMQLRPKGHNFTLPIYTLPFLKTRSSIDVFLALYDYSSGCSFPSFISPLLNFSGYLFIYYIIVHEVQNTHIQRKIGIVL